MNELVMKPIGIDYELISGKAKNLIEDRIGPAAFRYSWNKEKERDNKPYRKIYFETSRK